VKKIEDHLFMCEVTTGFIGIYIFLNKEVHLMIANTIARFYGTFCVQQQKSLMNEDILHQDKHYRQSNAI
jgi:hypothetical protein